ncbi:imidazolonepropionase-like domain-containing protein [Paraburkholderia xenovorans]
MEQRKGCVLEGKLVFGSLDAPREHGCVVTEGGRIAWVGSRDTLPPQYAGAEWERIDLPDSTITLRLIRSMARPSRMKSSHWSRKRCTGSARCARFMHGPAMRSSRPRKPVST